LAEHAQDFVACVSSKHRDRLTCSSGAKVRTFGAHGDQPALRGTCTRHAAACADFVRFLRRCGRFSFSKSHFQNRFAVGLFTLSLFSGAFISEIIRGGIESVGGSQLESARAIGLTRLQTYRYVIFPQAIRLILPALAGMFANLIKDSSLLSVISIEEFTWNAQQVSALTYSNFECYIPLAIGYLVLTLPITLWTQWLEKRTRYET